MRTEKKSHRSRMDPIVVLVLIFAAIFSSILVGGRIVKGKW